MVEQPAQQLDASQDVSHHVISEQEEWRLLLGVCPLFENEIRWVPINQSRIDEEVVEMTAGRFKSEIGLIKVLIPAQSSLPEDDHYEFMYRIQALLSSLEALLNDTIKAEGYPETDGEGSYKSDLLHRWPKLVALDHLLQSTDNKDTSAQLNRFVRLRQDARVFKRTSMDVQVFNDKIGSLLSCQRSERGTRLAKSERGKRRSKISDPYCSQSRRLFESLATHIQDCTRANLKHHTMLQLKHTEHQGDQQDLGEKASHPVFCMRFGSCSHRTSLIPTHCVVSTGVDIGNENSEWAEPVTKMCDNAGYARQNKQLFRLRLTEDRFFDISDADDCDILDERFMLKDPEKASMISLKNLLTRDILRDRYTFFPNDKKILAYTLAHALMNLHDNPWLQTLWTLDQIFFIQSCGTGTLYNIHQPYVSCVLSTEPPPLGTLDPLHTYPVVFSFAKLLWELETGDELLPEKVNKTGQESYWVTLRHLCQTATKHQFSHGYSKALEACVNFPKYVNREKAAGKDLKTAEKQAILKYIVHELESEVDLTRMDEWGTRDLDLNLKLQITAKGQSIHANSIQRTLKMQDDLYTQPASVQVNERSLRDGNLLGGLQKSRTDNSKDIRDVYSHDEQTTSNLGTPSCISSSSASSTPLLLTNNSPTKMPITLKRSLDDFDNALPRKTAKLVAGTTALSAAIEGASRTTTPLIVSQWVSDTHDSPREKVAERQIKDFNIEMGDGFGHMELFGASEPRPKISSETFSYLNHVVDEHWKYWEKDKPIRVAVLDTGFDWTHDDFQLPRTKTFTGEDKNISNPERGENPQASRVKACHNFCPDQAENDVSDVDGHGTQVAGIILRLAPHIHLYVARVCTGDRNRGLSGVQKLQLGMEEHRKPEPNILEKAIQWAIERQVHIINISLGYRKAEMSYIDKLRETLRQVQSNRQAVVFAATSNQGTHEPVAWPASSLSCAIGVHSCCDTGRKPSVFSAYPTKSHDAANFMVVGEKILSQWPMTKGGGFRVATGSSFANPVACAIGALILQFVQQKCCTQHRNRVKQRVFLKDLYANQGMTKVLKAISTEHSEGYDIINAKLFWGNLLPGHDAMEHAWQIIERALAN